MINVIGGKVIEECGEGGKRGLKSTRLFKGKILRKPTLFFILNGMINHSTIIILDKSYELYYG